MNDTAKILKEALCDSFAVRSDGPHRWTIRTPLVFDDGDGLPTFLRLLADGSWALTDDGMTMSHLFFDDFQSTDARLARIAALTEAHGAVIGARNELIMRLDASPTPFDVGDFLQLVSQVQGVALTSRAERDQTRFVSMVRSGIEKRLRSANYQENWSPPELRGTKAAYRADLRIGTDRPDTSVVLFAASTSDKVSVSALTAHQFRRASSGHLVPLLAYHPDRVSSEAVYRFQDEVKDDSAVVPTLVDGMMALTEALRHRGVDIATTAA